MEKPGGINLVLGLLAIAAGVVALLFHAGILGWLPVAMGAAMVVNGAYSRIAWQGVLNKNAAQFDDGAAVECLALSMVHVAAADGPPTLAAVARMDAVVVELLHIPFGAGRAEALAARGDLAAAVAATAAKAAEDRRDLIVRACAHVALADGPLSPARADRLAYVAQALGRTDALQAVLAEANLTQD